MVAMRGCCRTGSVCLNIYFNSINVIFYLFIYCYCFSCCGTVYGCININIRVSFRHSTNSQTRSHTFWPTANDSMHKCMSISNIYVCHLVIIILILFNVHAERRMRVHTIMDLWKFILFVFNLNLHTGQRAIIHIIIN